ncbi:MAG: LuxR C-terminal-related transcriptional regulator [Actinomycetes bacterium]
MSALSVWGLDDVAETVYRAMLRNPVLDEGGLARHLDLDAPALARALDALARVGLVSRTAAGLSPAPPATTLASLLHGEMRDLEERRAYLDAVRASLSGFAADHMVGQSRGWSSVPFELLSPDEAFAAVEDVQRGTTGEILSCDPVVEVDSESSAYFELAEQQLRAGRVMRGLYPADVVLDPRRLDHVRRWSRAGEDVRLIRSELPPMAVFGTEVALVSSTWGGETEGHLLIRAPALVGLVRDLFDQYWTRGTPLIPYERLDERRQVLEMMMLGTKDETIARQLGLSLRTVRRRIAELMSELGAATRFQAGLEAARRGLL